MNSADRSGVAQDHIYSVWDNLSGDYRVSLVIHGIGTMVYGERDYWPDGSFVTTEWFVLAWIPIIPICSKRISYRQDNPYANFDAGGGYYVYETLGVDRRQALFVYLWFWGVFGPLVIWVNFQDIMSKMIGDENWAAGLCLALTGVTFAAPTLLAPMG
ncbi:MAG: hypothetical protein LAO79_20360 [Acidobacteriia bacterium]|nr:hypothetical protein [Terriglobia bacterium]